MTLASLPLTAPALQSLFPETYTASRQAFVDSLNLVRARWPQAHLQSAPLPAGLPLEWIEAPSQRSPEQLILITAGEHGVEGFVGSAVLQLFIQTCLPLLDPETTGLCLVHAINPWGMEHHRRVNANNVDLNRNFCLRPEDCTPQVNPAYGRVQSFLNPSGPVTGNSAFLRGLLHSLARLGPAGLQSASLMGQYCDPNGIYYGGQEVQPETTRMMQLYREVTAPYAQVIVLDLHTGYGPRTQMSLVHSCQEARTPQMLQEQLHYPLIVRTNPQEFYAIQGDMIDYLYGWSQRERPGQYWYAVSFEFGTYGDSLAASIRSLRTMIQENQLRRFGASHPEIQEQVERQFLALFYPQEADWRLVALEQAHQALTGILRWEGALKEETHAD